jgi:hypothetical protein
MTCVSADKEGSNPQQRKVILNTIFIASAKMAHSWATGTEWAVKPTTQTYYIPETHC